MDLKPSLLPPSFQEALESRDTILIPQKRNAPTSIPITDENDVMKITPLGAGQEVGRSCVLLEYKEKVVMVREGDNCTIMGESYFFLVGLTWDFNPGTWNLES